MSIALQGLDSKLKSTPITISVSSRHPFARLGERTRLAAIGRPRYVGPAADHCKGVLESRSQTSTQDPFRSLCFAVPLEGNRSGSRVENQRYSCLSDFLRTGDNSSLEMPDHTKVEEFRNRLTPKTHQKIGVFVVKVAHELGFADPSWMDVDSTVQEANIAYPSDASS